MVEKDMNIKRRPGSALSLVLVSTSVVALGTMAVAACGGAIQTGPVGGADAGVDAPADSSVLPPPPPPLDAGPGPEEDAGSPPPFDGGPLSPAVEIDLGSVTAGVPVSVQIPPNTLGFHVSVKASVPQVELGVISIQSPSGAFVHNNGIPANGEHPTSGTLFGNVAAAQVPQSNHPDVMPGVLPGEYKIVFDGSGPMTAKVKVQTTPDGAFHGGNLNMHLYIPEGLVLADDPKPVRAGTAWAHPEVKSRLESTFRAILDLYDLHNGTVQFHAIPARYKSIADGELDSVFKETRVARAGQAMHIFLSEAAEDQQWWGIAAGIPGDANSPGSDQAGVALANIPEADAEMEGYVLAHELGHFFGLNHTTEFSGEADPLEDTPRCVDIDRDLRRCPDFSNVMFAAGAASGTVLSSPLQRRVVWGSPIVSAFATGPVITPGAGAGMRVLPRKAPDFGKLFGHAGVALSSTEQWVMAGLCRHPSHARIALSDARKAEARAISMNPAVPRLVRNVAARLARP
jgi:hypothetical protein